MRTSSRWAHVGRDSGRAPGPGVKCSGDSRSADTRRGAAASRGRADGCSAVASSVLWSRPSLQSRKAASPRRWTKPTGVRQWMAQPRWWRRADAPAAACELQAHEEGTSGSLDARRPLARTVRPEHGALRRATALQVSRAPAHDGHIASDSGKELRAHRLSVPALSGVKGCAGTQGGHR
jgi:hypothetical protein